VVSGNRANSGTQLVLTVGGGIYNLGTMTVTNSTIRDNIANDPLSFPSGPTGWAGGIYNEGNLTISGSDISANTTVNAGGGIWNVGNLSIANCTIQDNLTTDFWSYGGGIANDVVSASPGPQLLHLGNVTISNSLVTRNTAGFNGG